MDQGPDPGTPALASVGPGPLEHGAGGQGVPLYGAPKAPPRVPCHLPPRDGLHPHTHTPGAPGDGTPARRCWSQGKHSAAKRRARQAPSLPGTRGHEAPGRQVPPASPRGGPAGTREEGLPSEARPSAWAGLPAVTPKPSPLPHPGRSGLSTDLTYCGPHWEKGVGEGALCSSGNWGSTVHHHHPQEGMLSISLLWMVGLFTSV